MKHGNRFDKRAQGSLSAFGTQPFSMPFVGQGLHPFTGHLVDGNYAANWLIDALFKSDLPVDFCSAFLRSEALNSLLPDNRKLLSGRILTRWQLGDLRAGASDLNSYLVAKDFGFKFFIRQDFHGKVFSVPKIGTIVGSANATLAGFGLKEDGNAEVCTLVPPSDSNSIFINGLFSEAIEIDDALFVEISKTMHDIPLGEKDFANWPEELMSKLLPKQLANRFLTSECLVSVPVIADAGLLLIHNEHDRKLLGMHDLQPSRDAIAKMFKALKVHRWLIEKLSQAGGELYFGAVTADLHSALLDDPIAYRRDVKNLLQNLLSWYELLPECGILIDRPNYSQRIRLG
jgi:hypothetical protein